MDDSGVKERESFGRRPTAEVSTEVEIGGFGAEVREIASRLPLQGERIQNED